MPENKNEGSLAIGDETKDFRGFCNEALEIPSATSLRPVLCYAATTPKPTPQSAFLKKLILFFFSAHPLACFALRK